MQHGLWILFENDRFGTRLAAASRSHHFPHAFRSVSPSAQRRVKVLIKDEDATTQSSTRPERLSMPSHSM